MTHPYREKPAGEQEPAAARLDVVSMFFGFFCAIVGQALAGPACGLAVTFVGALLILGSNRDGARA